MNLLYLFSNIEFDTLMNNISNRLLSVLKKIFVLIAILILVDFVWPGQVYLEDILDIQRTREQYYNAARNSHVSFKVFTPNTSFHVSKAFAKSQWKSQQIEYAISPIFKEVNWYQIVNAEKKRAVFFKVVFWFYTTIGLSANSKYCIPI